LDEQLHAALHATDPHTRYNTLIQLTQSSPDAIDGLLPHLIALMQTHEDWGTRQGAAWAAGQLKLAGAAPALEYVITAPGEYEQVRFVAALALVYLNPQAAPAHLAVLADHPDEAVRRVAQAAFHALPYVGT